MQQLTAQGRHPQRQEGHPPTSRLPKLRGLSPEQRLEVYVQRGPADACWPWTGPVNNWGYGRIGRSGLGPHRVAFEQANGPIPAGMVVRHDCDNPPCCNPAHLRIGTAADNRRDCVARGRQTRGTAQHSAVLDDDKVREIRRRLEAGETPTALGIEYGVNRTSIAKIRDRRTWKHVGAQR